MKDLIAKVFNEKLEDGTIEKIIGKHIEDMVSDILNDQMKWNGETKKALEERIKPICLAAVSECDLSKTAAVVTELLNNALRGTPIHLLNDTLNGIKSLYSQNENIRGLKFGQTIKLSDIFKKYCEFIKGKTFDEDDLDEKGIESFDNDEQEGKYAYIGVEMTVEETETETYYGYKRSKFKVEMRSELNGEEEGLTFYVSESYDRTLRLEVETGGMLLAELSRIDPFIMYLIAVRNNYCNIQIDTGSEHEDVEVEVED